MRRTLSMVLAGVAVAAAMGALVLAYSCGAKQVRASEPGEPRNPETCVSSASAFEWGLLTLALVGAAGTWSRLRLLPLLLGVVLTLFGVIDLIGVGLFALPVGVFLLAAGLVMAPLTPRPDSSTGPL